MASVFPRLNPSRCLGQTRERPEGGNSRYHSGAAQPLSTPSIQQKCPAGQQRAPKPSILAPRASGPHFSGFCISQVIPRSGAGRGGWRSGSRLLGCFAVPTAPRVLSVLGCGAGLLAWAPRRLHTAVCREPLESQSLAGRSF